MRLSSLRLTCETERLPFVRFVCGCQAAVWLPLLILNLDFFGEIERLRDCLASSGFWNKMCDVSVKRLTMVVSWFVCASRLNGW